jgi:hypothetical protein
MRKVWPEIKRYFPKARKVLRMNGEPDPFEFDDCDPDESEMGELSFECPAFWTGKEWHCPLAGSEDCDWECPDGFVAKTQRGRK